MRRETTACVGCRFSASSSSASADADERAGLACPEVEARVRRGREPAELLGGRRRVQPAELRGRGAHDRLLDPTRLAGLDQLPGYGAQQRLSDGAGAHRPQPADPLQGLAEQRVAGEPAQELGVVVVEAEDEADVVDPGVAVCGGDDRPVGTLHRMHPFEPAIDADRRAVGAAGHDPGRVARMAAGLVEGVGAFRAELGADGHLPRV